MANQRVRESKILASIVCLLRALREGSKGIYIVFIPITRHGCPVLSQLRSDREKKYLLFTKNKINKIYK